jgi:lipoprotein NlpI
MRIVFIAGLFSLALHAACGPLSAIAQDQTSDASELLRQATRAAQRGNHEEAIALYSDVIRQDPKNAIAYYQRGSLNFIVGNVKKSVADFDRYVQLEPGAEPSQWKRGISYYYAGEYQKGAKQFELYQTYDKSDVENSTWRYLCVAATDGVEKAQKTLLPIENDPRVPMMQIYDLYRGKLTPEDVFKAVEIGNPTADAKNTREFYAHLYVGLWYQAADKRDLARKHIIEAEKRKISHYMWDVAHVHADLLRAEQKPDEKKSP